MKLLNLIMLSVCLLSCAHQIAPPAVSVTEELLFFPGTYKQKIQVTYVKDGKTDQAEFNAVLKKSDQEIYMYCYVGFGYTLFKIKDNLKQPVEFTTSDDRIAKNKDFFLKLYPLIKETLTLKASDPRLKNGEMTLTMKPEKFSVHIVISTEKMNGVPKQVVFENEKHFRFVVQNTEFNREAK